MAVTTQEWGQLLNDIEANFDVTFPDALNSILAGNITTLTKAKVVLVELCRVTSSLLLADALDKTLQTEKNLFANRVASARSGYETANPEFDPNTWMNYSNAEQFAMIQPYDPQGGVPDTIEAAFDKVNLLSGKVRDAKDKISNIHRKIVDTEAL